MTLTLHVVLTTTEFDDLHFVSTAMGNHFCSDSCAFNNRSANLDVCTVGNQVNLVELNNATGSEIDFFEFEGFTHNYAMLFATAFKNCICTHCLLQTFIQHVDVDDTK